MIPSTSYLKDALYRMEIDQTYNVIKYHALLKFCLKVHKKLCTSPMYTRNDYIKYIDI